MRPGGPSPVRSALSRSAELAWENFLVLGRVEKARSWESSARTLAVAEGPVGVG